MVQARVRVSRRVQHNFIILKIMTKKKEKLVSGELIIRVCPITRKVVLAQLLSEAEIIDLHNDTVASDISEVNNFIKQFS